MSSENLLILSLVSSFYCISAKMVLTKLSSIFCVLKCYIKLRFKILSGLSDCISRHQVVHNALSKSLPRCCSSDQGSPRTCKCGGSSRAEIPASWPCHCSSTLASPQRARACQFHGSAGETRVILLPKNMFHHLGKAVISIVWPLNSIIFHQAVVKGTLKLDKYYQSTHNQLITNE